MTRIKNKIAHSQIRRLMKRNTHKFLAKEAVIEMKNSLIEKIREICNDSLDKMRLLGLKTLREDLIDIPAIRNKNNTFSKETIKRIIKENKKIERVPKSSLMKIIYYLEYFVGDITKESERMATHRGCKTIEKSDVYWSVNSY